MEDKSTVPVSTVDKVLKADATNYTGEFDVVSNPEFLREGVALDEFMKPDRVIVGTNSERAIKLMCELNATFMRQGKSFILLNEKSVELTKYAANSFLASKISFMKKIAQLSEKLGADVDKLRRGIRRDECIVKRFLFPGKVMAAASSLSCLSFNQICRLSELRLQDIESSGSGKREAETTPNAQD
jgi:UDPglucose 6-dehydrogenase